MNSGDLARVIDEMLDGWRSFVNDEATLTDIRGRTDEQVATIMALTAHVHATALVLRSALPDELTIAHMPLVRSIFESTITVVWCDEVADGTQALMNEGARQRRNLRDALARTRSMADMAHQMEISSAVLPTSSTEQARIIEKRCEDVAFDGAYALYRMLSGLGHASIQTIDAYLDEDSFQHGRRISVKSNPGAMGSSFTWAHIVASCLVWSGRVADFLDRERTRRNDLRRIAREMGIPDILAVNVDAHMRGRATTT